MPQELVYEYEPRIAELYDYVELHRTRGDEEFYAGRARESGGPVLELASGTGRILLPIAREGIEVVGLELSKAMINECRRKLEQEPTEVQSRVSIQQGDMRHFELGRTFALVTIPFNSFLQMLTVDDQLAVLGSVRRHLDNGGQLLIDIFHPHIPYLIDESRKVKASEDAPVELPDGRIMSRINRNPSVDLPNQLVSAESIYTVKHPDGRVETFIHRFQIRYIFRWEIEHLLARAGFKVTNIYGGFDRQPFGLTEPGLMLTVAMPA